MEEEKKDEESDVVNDGVNQEQFKEELATKLGISGLPSVEKEKLLDGVLSTLFQKILYGASEKLSPEDQEIFAEKLESITDDSDPAQAQATIDTFLSQALPNYEAYVAKTTQEFFDDLDTFKEETDLSAAKA